MNPSSKILIAAALLAVGYGVASLLGSPDAPYLPGSNALPASTYGIGPDDPSGPSAGRFATGARLLPDPTAEYAVTTDPTAVPLDGNGAMESIPDSLVGGAVSPDAISMASGLDRSGLEPVLRRPPRARLSDAAVDSPRGTPSESHLLSSNAGARAGIRGASSAAENWTAGDVPPSEAAATADFTPVDTPYNRSIQTSYDSTPRALADRATVEIVQRKDSTGSARPHASEVDAMKTHIVIDGDSLPRLAGRYLDDPQRAEEIFSLNREVLASADLLPIGAELKIPARERIAVVEKLAESSTAVDYEALATAPETELVPIRSVPPVYDPYPRAHLVRP